MKNVLPKDNNNLLVTDLNNMEIFKFANKQFKITVLRKLSKTKRLVFEKTKWTNL